MPNDASSAEPTLMRHALHIPVGLLFLSVLCVIFVHPICKNARLADAAPMALSHEYLSQFSAKEYALMYVFSVFIFFNVMFLWENARAMLHPPPRRLSLTSHYVDARPRKVPNMEAFEYDTPMTCYEWAKCIFFIVTGIAFVRVCVAVCLTLSGMAIMSVAGDRRKGPVWFRCFAATTRVLGLIVLSALGMHHIYIYGSFALPADCKLLIGNHSCVLEVLMIFILADYPSFVSRKENGHVPFFKGVAKASEAILVDRGAATSRQQTKDAIYARAKDPDGAQLMIFPEGTTANQRTLFLFKKGAFEPGEPVQMVCIYFPYRHFNPAWMGRAVGGNGFWDILVRLSCQFTNHVELRPLPVYYPTEEEKCDPILYAAHCQRMMAEVLRENISDAVFRDYAAAGQRYAGKMKHTKEKA